MNSSIVQLPTEVAEKIAAGEVIERPFSVAKELIENSLDAQSTRIEIFIVEGGKSLIQIQDDGIGMHPEEITLALKRHATSKIRSFEDLFSLSTLGFRGEALPSIAAVSRFSIRSRAKESAHISGFEVFLEGGNIVRHQEIGHPVGTTVIVEDLFFNVPARLKFLKSPNTEWNHLEDYITSMALAYPHVQWIVHHNKKEKIRFVQKELSKRMIEVWGSETFESFYPMSYERSGLRLSGYLGHPNLSQSQSKSGYLFLNGRPLKDRLLNHAVMTGYRSLLMKDQFPLVVLFLEVPAEMVDVNVHPTKREVRFTSPNVIHQFVSESIRDFLSRMPWKDSMNHSSQFSAEPSPFQWKSEQRAESPPTSILSAQAHAVQSFGQAATLRENEKRYFSTKEENFAPPLTHQKELLTQSLPTQETFFKAGRLPFSSLKVIGQLKGTYILCESEEHLVLIDQHAAHERIGFEKLRQAYRSNSLKSQQLLLPQILEVKDSEKEIIQPHLDFLKKLGLEIEEFGTNTLVIKAVPAVLGEMEVFPLLRALLADFEDHGASQLLEERLDEIFALIACHRQIRAGDLLSHPEMEELIAQLDEGAYSYHCPHGRPVMVQVTYREIEKWFKRIV